MDLCQDVMINALPGLQKFEGRSSFSVWLFSIARSRCRGEVRRPEPIVEAEFDMELFRDNLQMTTASPAEKRPSPGPMHAGSRGRLIDSEWRRPGGKAWLYKRGLASFRFCQVNAHRVSKQ